MTAITLTYLEQTSPDDVRPAKEPQPAVEVRLVEEISPEFARYFYASVGGAWYWTSKLSWTWNTWIQWLTRALTSVRRRPKYRGLSVVGMSREAVRQRYLEINGVHPMSPADDAYVSMQFRVLEGLCAEHGRDVEEARRLMLDSQLPLPGYLRSDGSEMVPADLFELLDQYGDGLRAWFVGQWPDPVEGEAEWASYLSGRYVCLHTVNPTTIQRKDQLMRAIEVAPRNEVKKLVDELDEFEPEFTEYDRLRFGGPVSRDTHITTVRAQLNL